MTALFPELDGVFPAPAEDRPPSTAAGDATQHSPSSPIRAGVRALRNFARALGLEDTLLEVTLLPGPRLSFVVASEDGQRELFSVVPPEDHAWLRAPGFGIQHRGESLSRPLATRLRRFVARYRGATLAQLASRVLPDAEDQHALAWDNPKSLFYSYASAKAWRTFFEDQELYRGVCERFAGNVVYVSHEELECNFNAVRASSSALSFFNTVEVRRERASASELRFLSTDLQDLDVIKGGDAKLDQALESVAALERKPSMVLVAATCVPLVTGDDIEASAARARAKLQLPVVYVGK